MNHDFARGDRLIAVDPSSWFGARLELRGGCVTVTSVLKSSNTSDKTTPVRSRERLEESRA